MNPTRTRTLRHFLFGGGTLLFTALVVQAGKVTQQGILKKIDSFHLVLTIRGKDVGFRIDAATHISLDRKPAKITDLKLGDSAVVTSTAPATPSKPDNLPFATWIDAHRNSTPGNPDPLPNRGADR